MSLKRGDAVSFSGIEGIADWYFDPDHFTGTGSDLKFNAVEGWYSVEMDIDAGFVTVRRVKQDGKAATFKDEGAIRHGMGTCPSCDDKPARMGERCLDNYGRD